MKNFIIHSIRLYQKIPGNIHRQCRFIPTCSEYAIEAITIYGIKKGTYLTIKRILKCNPWGPTGYDPVPLERK